MRQEMPDIFPKSLKSKKTREELWGWFFSQYNDKVKEVVNKIDLKRKEEGKRGVKRLRKRDYRAYEEKISTREICDFFIDGEYMGCLWYSKSTRRIFEGGLPFGSSYDMKWWLIDRGWVSKKDYEEGDE